LLLLAPRTFDKRVACARASSPAVPWTTPLCAPKALRSVLRHRRPHPLSQRRLSSRVTQCLTVKEVVARVVPSQNPVLKPNLSFTPVVLSFERPIGPLRGVPMPIFVGHARVSTQDQDLALQLDALQAAGCARICFVDATDCQSDIIPAISAGPLSRMLLPRPLHTPDPLSS
jgi:hypothetical protein